MNSKLKNLLKLSSILLFSLISCSISIYSILLIKKHTHLIDKTHNVWLLSIAINALVIFCFLALLQVYLKKGKPNKEDLKRNAFILMLVLAKTIFWSIIITILTSNKKDLERLWIASGVILLFSVMMIHFVHTFMTKGLYKKFFVETKKDKKSKEIQSSSWKKIQYTLCVLGVCLIFALPMMLIRLGIAFLPEIPINVNITLFGKEIAFLNSHHNMLWLCIIDCVCLIFGFLLIGKLSDYLFIQMNKSDNLEERARYQFREAIIKNIDFDIMKKMIDDSSLKIDQGSIIDLILNQKEKNTFMEILILSHNYFEKEKRKNLDYDIDNLEKQIRGIKDKNQKKIAKIAIDEKR